MAKFFSPGGYLRFLIRIRGSHGRKNMHKLLTGYSVVLNHLKTPQNQIDIFKYFINLNYVGKSCLKH